MAAILRTFACHSSWNSQVLQCTAFSFKLCNALAVGLPAGDNDAICDRLALTKFHILRSSAAHVRRLYLSLPTHPSKHFSFVVTDATPEPKHR